MARIGLFELLFLGAIVLLIALIVVGPRKLPEIGRLVLEAMAEFAPDIGDCVAEYEVLGPPDIERRIGLTGGHIFQGETLPDQMWEHRLTPRTPVAGLYLCGAATHPAGSVIALNGRNAAMAVLADTTTARSRPPADDR